MKSPDYFLTRIFKVFSQTFIYVIRNWIELVDEGNFVLVFLTDAEQPNDEDAIIDYFDDLYCPACDKSFKSDKA